MPTKEKLSINRVVNSLKPREELKILRQITKIISSSMDLEEVLRQIVDVVVGITKADACLLYLFDERSEELVLRASKNPHPHMLGKMRMKLGEGITGWVAKEKKPVSISKNASDDPRFKFFHSLPEDRYQAFLSVSIVHKIKTIGVINVQHKKPHRYTGNMVRLISTIASQVGGAIENARLYEEAQRKAAQINNLSRISKTIISNNYLEEILNLIVTVTAEMMGSKICSIMLLDNKNRELIIKATQSLSEEYKKKPNIKVGQSISGRVVKERNPITVVDVRKEKGYMYPELAGKEGLHSLLSVPMMIKDKIIGVINTYTSREHRFTDEEIRILQTIANQAAITIENTKLTEETLTLKETLEVRKLVERAKGILMKEANLSEDEAYRLIHKKSMDSCKPMRRIAEAIIITWEMKK